MNELRPKTEQPKEQTTPTVVREPSPTGVPTKPIGVTPQPKVPESGGNRPYVASTTKPAPVVTSGKP
jgi:hypothetical protein